MSRLRVLLISPHFERDAVGESYMAFKWAEALSSKVDLTVLAFQRPTHPPLAETLPLAKEVRTWPHPAWSRRFERFDAMLKPTWPAYCGHVRRWLAKRRGEFDVAHQIMPQAARYASPLRGAGPPYLIGPLGGLLTTPEAFKPEMAAAAWFTRLRALDGLRLAWDPWLRGSYAQAEIVLGVAPYMRDVLSAAPMRRFEAVLELGVDGVAPATPRAPRSGALRLLHVGRGVRTKGLRDAVRALAHLKDLPGVTLTSAGAGEEIALCKAEAERLGVADRVRFAGRIPRADVEALYAESDVFVFPSFREPAGGVLYEAMRWGLPVIAARRGGPDWIIDDSCGLKVEVDTPEAMARDVAAAIRRLHDDPALRARLGAAAREKLLREGLWPRKADNLIELYHEAVEAATLRAGKDARGAR